MVDVLTVEERDHGNAENEPTQNVVCTNAEAEALRTRSSDCQQLACCETRSADLSYADVAFALVLLIYVGTSIS